MSPNLLHCSKDKTFRTNWFLLVPRVAMGGNQKSGHTATCTRTERIQRHHSTAPMPRRIITTTNLRVCVVNKKRVDAPSMGCFVVSLPPSSSTTTHPYGCIARACMPGFLKTTTVVVVVVVCCCCCCCCCYRKRKDGTRQPTLDEMPRPNPSCGGQHVVAACYTQTHVDQPRAGGRSSRGANVAAAAARGLEKKFGKKTTWGCVCCKS